MEFWPQYLVASVGILFVFSIVGVILAYFVAMSPSATRRLCNIGMLSFFILSCSCGALFIWHHYYRI